MEEIKMKLSCENTKKILDEINNATGRTVDYSTKDGCYEYLTAIDKAIKTAKKKIDALETPKIYLLDQIEDKLRENASAFINVGDIIKFKLKTDEDMTVVCIGKNHDCMEDGTKAGLTFAPLTFPDGEFFINKDTNEGGWGKCYMRNVTLVRLLKLFPDVLQDLIVPVIKLTGNDGKLEKTVDKLFLLSVQEYSGKEKDYNVQNGEGKQYEWFKEGNKLDDKYWWTRSPSTNAINLWNAVTITGYIVNFSVNSTTYVCPCFCIK